MGPGVRRDDKHQGYDVWITFEEPRSCN
jgi:hypothetical protein